MTERRKWSEIRKRRLNERGALAAYERARRAHELGEAIRARRQEVGLSQRELAERMGTAQSVVARLEAGAVTPTLGTLDRVADALGTELLVEFRPHRRRPRAERVPT